jgi:hypothetical protein
MLVNSTPFVEVVNLDSLNTYDVGTTYPRLMKLQTTDY